MEQAAGQNGSAKAMTDISMPVKRAHQVLRQVALSHSTRMVEREVLKEVIQDTNRRFLGCLMLPITLSFFALFAVSTIIHEDVAMKHMLDFPTRNALNPLLGEDDDGPTPDMLDGVSKPDEVWSYLENVFVPYFYRDTDAYGQPLPEEKLGTFGEYNQVLGGIILTLERSYNETCQNKLVNHLTCFPDTALSIDKFGGNISDIYTPDKGDAYWFTENDSLLSCADEGFVIPACDSNDTVNERKSAPMDIWSIERRLGVDIGLEEADRRLEALRAEMTGLMPVKSTLLSRVVAGRQSESYKFILNSAETVERNMARLRYLQDRGWIDEHTTSLQVKLVAYNYQLEIPRLLSVDFIFFFSRGGGVYSTQRIEVTPLKTFNHPAALPVDILFLLTLIASSAYIVREFLNDMKDGKLLGHFHLGNLVTWFSCLGGWLYLGLLLGLMVLRKFTNQSIEDYFTYRDVQATDDVISRSNNTAFFAYPFRLFISYMHLLFMFRCFIALQWQPRLAIITETLKSAFVDLLHILIVLMPTWFGFALAGNFLFGRRLQAFNSVQSAVATCIQLVLEGEYDWQSLSEEDFFTAVAWMWLYMVLLVLIMLNVVLAIIMDVFAEVRRKSGETMTIWEHCSYLVKRAIYHKHWVKERDLWERVSEMPQTIVIDEIRAAYPMMPDFQLRFLTQSSTNMTRVIQRTGIDPTYTMQMVSAIQVSLDEILADLGKLNSRGWLGKGLEVPNDEDRDYVKEILSGIAVQSHWMNLSKTHLSTLHAKLGLQESVNSEWKTVKKVEVPANKVRQGND